MEFNNYLFHCSSLGSIMTEPRGKSNLEKYKEAQDKFNSWKEKFEKVKLELDTFKNKETKTYQNKAQTMGNYEDKMWLAHETMTTLEYIKDAKPLSDTCKKYLMNLFVQAKYGRVKDIKLKYWDKGNMLEEDAFTIYSRLIKEYVEKNTVTKSNPYVVGTIDFPARDKVIIHDTKVSWDIYTFWSSLANGLEDDYYWQAQGYMWLWELDEAKVIKMLLDTPDKLIEAEKKSLLRDFIGSEFQYQEACAELDKLHKYDDIPVEERIIEFKVERSDEDIARIPERVEMCRAWLNSIKPGTYFTI